MAEEQRTILNDLGKLDEFLQERVKERMQERGSTYRDALLQTANELPQLFRLREALYREREGRKIGLKQYQVIEGELVQVEEDIKGLIANVQEAHPDLNYRQAMNVTLTEHPEIWQRREELRRQIHG